MLREVRPKTYRVYEMSHLAAEYHAFAAWLRETGYSDDLVGEHLCRLRNVLEAGNAAAEQNWSADALKGMFECYCRRRFHRQTVDYHAARRAYERYLDARGRLQRKEPPDDPFRPFRTTYRKYLEEVRGFCLATTTQHLSTVGEFLVSALARGGSPTRLTGAHIERYLSHKSKTCD